MRPALALAWRCCGLSLGIVWSCLFCDYVLLTMAIPIFPLIHASDFMTGLLFAAKAMCQIVCAPMFGGFIDRHVKGMILLGLVMEVFTLGIFAATFSYGYWVVARGLSGVASAAIISAGFAHLQRAFQEPEERSMAMGLAATGIIAGVCFGPVWGGTLYEVHPALPFLLLAAVELALLGTVALGLSSNGMSASEKQADQVSMVGMLRCGDVARVLGALALANAAIANLESTTARYFMKTFGFSVGQVSVFYMFTSVPSCLMSGLAGAVANHIGAWRVMGLGLALQGVFTLLGPKDVLCMEMLCFALLGAGMGATDGTAPAILGDIADSKFGGTGRIYLMSNIAVQSGFVMGPVLGNAVVEVGGFPLGMLVMGGTLLLYAATFAAGGLPGKRPAGVSPEPLLA